MCAADRVPSLADFACEVYPLLGAEALPPGLLPRAGGVRRGPHPAAHRHHAAPARQEHGSYHAPPRLPAGPRSRPARGHRLPTPAALASKFNRRVQRILDLRREYAAHFPRHHDQARDQAANYIRTADEVEIIGRRGGLLSVGREGSLTGNRVGASSSTTSTRTRWRPTRPSYARIAGEWYTSVVRTRMHNRSRELIVFTRWHDEDLIGRLLRRERVVELRAWGAARHDASRRVAAPSTSRPSRRRRPRRSTPGPPVRRCGREQHDAALLADKRRLDPLQFECMYQGRPAAREGLLSTVRTSRSTRSCRASWCAWPTTPTRPTRATTTSVRSAYAVDTDGAVYVTDVVYLARADGGDRGARGCDAARGGRAPGLRGEQQRRPRLRPGGAGSGLRACAWSGFHQSASSSEARILHSGHGAPHAALPAGMAAALARSSGPPDSVSLPAQVPREPLARRPGTCSRASSSASKRPPTGNGQAARRAVFLESAQRFAARRTEYDGGVCYLRGGADTLRPRPQGNDASAAAARPASRPASDRCPTGVRPVSGRLFTAAEAAHRAATVSGHDGPARRRRRAVRGARSCRMPRCGAYGDQLAHALDNLSARQALAPQKA